MDKTQYTLTVNSEQARIIIAALDLYGRVGMQQFEVFAEAIRDLKIEREENVNHDTLDMVKGILKTVKSPPLLNGSFGIASPEVPDRYKVAYDLQCVLRKAVHDEESGGSYSVWSHDPSHLVSRIPLAKVRVGV